MIEVTTCGPCGANLIRWDKGDHWANTQNGTLYCSETTPDHRHQPNPDAGIVQIHPDALGPMLVGIPWIDDVPIANAGYLGPGGWAQEVMEPSPASVMDPGPASIVDPYRTRQPDPGVTVDWGKLYDSVRSRSTDNPRCSICGVAVVRGIKLGNASKAAPWVAPDGRPCLGGLTHRPGRLHQVAGQINYPLDEAPTGRCSGCGEQVWQRQDKLWVNRDGFLACAPPPGAARHQPGLESTSCRWCLKPIRRAGVDANGSSVWRRTGIGMDDPQREFEVCSMAPDDAMPHMPAPAVRATMPVNGAGLPIGGPGAQLHMPGDRRFTLTPMEAVALIRELAMTDQEIHRMAARMLIREMIPNGQIMPRFEDLADALGLLDLLPKPLELRLSGDATAAQIWAGNLMLEEMDEAEVITCVMDLMAILVEIRGKAADDDQPRD